MVINYPDAVAIAKSATELAIQHNLLHIPPRKKRRRKLRGSTTLSVKNWQVLKKNSYRLSLGSN